MTAPKRLAVIDLGTNSVRFEVYEVDEGGKATRVCRERLMLRLGQGVYAGGKLAPRAIQRTLKSFIRFEREAKKHNADRVIAFGTGVLRETPGAPKLVKEIRDQTGIDVRVISGLEEARLISKGVFANEKGLTGTYALVDIGGGSTEISVCHGKRVLRSASFPLGASRLHQVFLKESPPRDDSAIDSIQALRDHARSVLCPHLRKERWPRVTRIVGSSGTIRMLAKVLSEDGKSLRAKDLSALVAKMSTMTKHQLAMIPGIERNRADMILAGAVLLEEVMAALGATRARATEYSLRHGILEEESRMKKT